MKNLIEIDVSNTATITITHKGRFLLSSPLKGVSNKLKARPTMRAKETKDEFNERLTKWKLDFENHVRKIILKMFLSSVIYSELANKVKFNYK